MDLLPTYLKRFWRYLTNGIALVPALLVLGFALAALGLAWLETTGFSNSFDDENNYFFLIESMNTARTILSVVIGGIISLTVFSYSQVMVVLSQATNTLSPRLLPQLIRDRSHQVTLGIYLGTIVFCFLTLINLRPYADEQINAFSVFVCVVLGIVCLVMFVYFISSISRRIQVGAVILRVRRQAMRDLRLWINRPKGWSENEPPPEIEEWHPVTLSRSGYVDIPTYEQLSRMATRYDTAIYLTAPRSAFVLEGTEIVRTSRKLSAEEAEKMGRDIELSRDDLSLIWYLPALRHITEVAVKAMSPGINDPGTAIESIDMLTDILGRALEVPRFTKYVHHDKGGTVYFARMGIDRVLRMIFQEIRTYSKADPMVMKRLLLSAFQLHEKAAGQQDCRDALGIEIKALEEDARASIANSFDLRDLLVLKNRYQQKTGHFPRGK